MGAEVILHSRVQRITVAEILRAPPDGANDDATAALPISRTLIVAVPVGGRFIVAATGAILVAVVAFVAVFVLLVVHVLQGRLSGKGRRFDDGHRRCCRGKASRQSYDQRDGF